MDHEQTMGVNCRVLDLKQQNIFGRISLFWSLELQGHPEQLNRLRRGGHHKMSLHGGATVWGAY